MEHGAKLKFKLAAFDPRGTLVGQNDFAVADLSPNWFDLLAALLRDKGDQFAVNFGGTLSHVSLRFTAAEGAALATFSVGGNLAVSLLLLSGRNDSIETEISEMFIVSVAKTFGKPVVFAELKQLKERPMVAVVPWGNTKISTQDEDVVQELSQHFAGAFFKKELLNTATQG